MRLSEARLFFEEMGCSHFHMSRDNPALYERYRACGISKEQEYLWRRACIESICAGLVAGTSAEWESFMRLIDLCEYQGDLEALRFLDRTAERAHEKLPPKGGLIVAECLLGSSNDGGSVHFAVKLRQTVIARRLAEKARVLAERAYKRRVEPSRVEAALKRYVSVKRHFRL